MGVSDGMFELDLARKELSLNSGRAQRNCDIRKKRIIGGHYQSHESLSKGKIESPKDPELCTSTPGGDWLKSYNVLFD